MKAGQYFALANHMAWRLVWGRQSYLDGSPKPWGWADVRIRRRTVRLHFLGEV